MYTSNIHCSDQIMLMLADLTMIISHDNGRELIKSSYNKPGNHLQTIYRQYIHIYNVPLRSRPNISFFYSSACKSDVLIKRADQDKLIYMHIKINSCIDSVCRVFIADNIYLCYNNIYILHSTYVRLWQCDLAFIRVRLRKYFLHYPSETKRYN